MSKSGGGDVKRFTWSSYSTRTSEFLKEVEKKSNRAILVSGVSQSCLVQNRLEIWSQWKLWFCGLVE